MKWLAACLFAILLVPVTAQPSDACGIKLTIKGTPPRTAAARTAKTEPVRSKTRDVTAAQEKRTPIAAGPAKPTDRRLIAAKPPTPPAPTPAAEPTPAPAPAPTPPTRVVTERPAPPAELRPTPPTTEVKPLKADAQLAEVYFSVNASRSSMNAQLDRVARELSTHPTTRVRIEGYADPTGIPADNMTLSQARAESVRSYLIAKGIDTSRLDVSALGDTVLKYSRTDGRNRRVVIVVQ